MKKRKWWFGFTVLMAFAAQSETLVPTELTHSIKAGKASQQRVAHATDATIEANLALQAAQQRLRDLDAYNLYMQTLVNDQQHKMDELSQQISAVEETKRSVIPLMLQMIDDLKQQINLDVPLRLTERQQRITRLEATLANADVSEAEKFRQIIQAYQIEAEYGHRLDSYTQMLLLDDRLRQVEILAVGRISLLAMTADRQQAWRWSSSQKSWQHIDNQDLNNIKHAFDIADKKQTPQLLNVPFSIGRIQEQM